MRDVHEPHDAEDERQPGGKHGVEAADEHALQDDVDPVDHRRFTVRSNPQPARRTRRKVHTPK